MVLVVKNSPASAGDAGLIPGSERSPGVGNGKALQYFSLENSIDRGLWRATIPLGSKITADGDCSHEIKRHLFFGRKVMTNLE